MGKTKLVKSKGTKNRPQTYDEWLKRNEMAAKIMKDHSQMMSVEERIKGNDTCKNNSKQKVSDI